MSVGRLLAMGRYHAAKAIKAMSPEMRLKLAHLASLGAAKKAAELAEYTNLIHDLTQEYTR